MISPIVEANIPHITSGTNSPYDIRASESASVSCPRLCEEQTGHPRIVMSMGPRYHNKSVEEYRQLAEKCRAEGGSGPPEKVFNEFWKPSRGRLGARRGRKLLDDDKAVDFSLQAGF